MKKNFTLLFSLIALVASGQTTVFGMNRLRTAIAPATPINVGPPNPAFTTKLTAPAALASGLAINIASAPLQQIAATQLSTNASSELANLSDVNSIADNQIAFSNVADVMAKGLKTTFNDQAVLMSSEDSGTNSGAIDVINTKISNIGSYVSSGLDAQNKAILILEAPASNLGSAVKTLDTYGNTNSTALNEGQISNKRASGLIQPVLLSGFTPSAKQSTTTVESPYTSTTTGFTPVHIAGKTTTVENLVPTSTLNMAFADSSALNTAMNTGATNAVASVRAAADSTSRINTIGNTGALKIANALTHSNGGLLTGSAIGADKNYAQNKINVTNDNG